MLAEREGFEPPEVLPSTVFKTAAIDHSAISPGAKVLPFLIFASGFKKNLVEGMCGNLGVGVRKGVRWGSCNMLCEKKLRAGF